MLQWKLKSQPQDNFKQKDALNLTFRFRLGASQRRI